MGDRCSGLGRSSSPGQAGVCWRMARVSGASGSQRGPGVSGWHQSGKLGWWSRASLGKCFWLYGVFYFCCCWGWRSRWQVTDWPADPKSRGLRKKKSTQWVMRNACAGRFDKWRRNRTRWPAEGRTMAIPEQKSTKNSKELRCYLIFKLRS